jgi:hypothetical protein
MGIDEKTNTNKQENKQKQQKNSRFRNNRISDLV